MKLLILSLLLSSQAYTKTLKLAFLAPDGTNWAKSLGNMADEIKEATKGRVKFKLYFGGVAGDESDVLRKSRIGQFHGGIFTGKTLGDIYPEARLMEIPFTFTDKKEKTLTALSKVNEDLSKGFLKKKFVSLGLYEIGQVYLVSTKKLKNLDSLKGLKIWTWEGDKIVEEMMKSLKLVSVPLALPDVLSSLSTGIIEAAYAPPLGITALQWHTKIKYIVNYPVAYSIGALLINQKAWRKIKKEDQTLIQTIAKKHIDKANTITAEENNSTLVEFKELGIEFIDFPKSDYDKKESIRKDVLEKLSGSFFNKKSLEKFENLIKSL